MHRSDDNINKISQIKMIPIGYLKNYAGNARTHDDDQIEELVNSIKEFGFNNPILIDKNNLIVAGHGRLLAAKKLGLTSVPTVRLDHLTDVQRIAYTLADNRIALNAGWDNEKLSQELTQLKNDDFDLDLLGFDDDELSDLVMDDENFQPNIREESESGYKEKLDMTVYCNDQNQLDDLFQELNKRGFKVKM